MSKWDESETDLENRIEALEKSIWLLREVTDGHRAVLRNILEVLEILNESRGAKPWTS